MALTQCDTCNESLAPFRFDGNSATCRDCQRWGKTRIQNATPFSFMTQIQALYKDQAARRWLEDWQARAAQHGTASRRGVGVID